MLWLSVTFKNVLKLCLETKVASFVPLGLKTIGNVVDLYVSEVRKDIALTQWINTIYFWYRYSLFSTVIILFVCNCIVKVCKGNEDDLLK